MALTNACETETLIGRHLTESEVILIADHTATKNGFRLQDFTKHTRFYPEEEKGTWAVFYEAKPDSPEARYLGSDFSVFVNDGTKETWLIPGR